MNLNNLTMYCLLGFSILVYSCAKEKNILSTLEIEEYAKTKWVYFDCSAGKYFQTFGATYLENTSGSTPEDVQKIEVWRKQVYLLVKNKLSRYNLAQGREEKSYNNTNDYSITSFDIDTLHQKIYWIDSKDKNLYEYGMKEDSVLHRFLLPREVWDNCVYLSNNKLLLTTCSYPNNIYYIIDVTDGSIQKHQQTVVKKADNVIFNDTLGLSACLIGYATDGILYKSLLQDTVYQWNGKEFIPKFLCNVGANRLSYQSEKIKFKNNDMQTLTHLSQIGKWYFLTYKTKTQNGKYYSTGMKILDTDMKLIETSDIGFYINKKTIRLLPKHPYYPNKERTSLFQIYIKGTPIGPPEKIPENMKNHKNHNDLILNYFTF